MTRTLYERYYTNTHRNIVQGRFLMPDGTVLMRKLASFAETGLRPGTGEAVDKSKAAALAREQLLSERYDQVEATLVGTRTGAGTIPKFSAAWQRFITARTPYLSQGTLNLYARTLRYYLAAAGDHPLATTHPDGRTRRYDQAHADKFLAWLRDHRVQPTTPKDPGRPAQPPRPMSTASINTHLQQLGAFLHWAYQDAQLLDQPAHVRQLPKLHRAARAPAPADVQRLLDHLAHLQRPDVTPHSGDRWAYHLHQRYVVTLLGTGCRRAEVFWLPWRAIDTEAGVVRVRTTTQVRVKERRDKDVPLLGFARDYLHQVREAHPDEVWLLDAGGQRQGHLRYTNPDALTLALRRHWQALGVEPGKAVHSFRAFYATMAEQAGVAASELQRILGHQQITTTLGYLADPEQAKRRGADTLSRLGPQWKIHNKSVTPPSGPPKHTGETGA